MVRAGYDPQGAVELQKTFVKMSEGKQPGWLEGMFSSHPVSQERVENNQRMAAALPKGGIVGEDRFQRVMARLRKTESAYQAYDKAQKALHNGDKKTARSLIKKAIRIEPKEGHFYSFLGDIEYRDKRYKTARGFYDKAIDRNEAFFYYHLRRGLVNEKLEHPVAAKQDLQRSTQLLPTAGAYNALGNLSRKQGDLNAAKQYYASAAQHPSDVGKQAFASLVELDLPQNPQNYLKLRNVSDALGRWYVEIANPTPRDVRNLVIELRYPDGKGNIRRSKRQLSGTIKAGAKLRLNTRMRVEPKLADHYGSKLIEAQLAD